MRTWKIVAIVAGLVTLAALLTGTFIVGMRVGEARAMLFAALGEPLPPLPPGVRTRLIVHGMVGQVEQINLGERSIVVVTGDGTRRRVLLHDDTVLERYGERVELGGVKAGERVVVIGAPDEQGHIIARAIRLLGKPREKGGSLWPILLRLAGRLYNLAHPVRAWFLWRNGL